MLSKHFKILSIAIIAAIAPNLMAQDGEELSFSTTKVADGLYMIAGKTGFTGGNIGLTIGDDGVAMIDDGLPAVLELLKEEVAKLTDQPIDYLINTHVHGDHTGNNMHFGKDGAQIISHENLRANMVNKGLQTEEGKVEAPKDALPVLTFSDRMTLHINGDAAKIIHFKDAHTDGDAVIHFTKANVVHTGDILFNERFPYIDKGNGGSVDGVIAALKSIAEMCNDDTKVIPGHGDLTDKAGVLKTVAMIEDAKQLVAKMVADGKTDEEIVAADPLSKYQDYSWGFITSEKMVGQLLADLR